MTEVVPLLKWMVATESVSGNEATLQANLASWLRDHDIEPFLSGRNLWARRGNPQGPRILLNSHLDTVPPSPDWSSDPWSAHEKDGYLVGLGSNDAKASGAAMLCAFAHLSSDLRERGEIILALTCDEETGGDGLERLIHDLPPLDAGVIGEPTDLRPAICQRGLLKLRMVAQGQAGHASRPQEGDNAIHKAARAIVQLEEVDLGPSHPLLGTATVQVTLVQGGTKSNVLPALCEGTLDCRTTPAMNNERLLQGIQDGAPGVTFETISNRIGPIETDRDASVVRSAIAACPDQPDPIAFGGVSDRFWLGSTPSVILGPGLSRWSHQAEERIELVRVEQAVHVYQNLIEHWFAENEEGP